jgi:hypothetical protein
VTYTRRVWSAASGREAVAPTAKDMGDIDTALFEQDARIAALEAALEALDARVVVLEEAP